MMYGNHCLKHWSSTQTTLNLSTAEAELHGIAKGIKVALGYKSMCADMNLHNPLHIHSDATAAIGIARRRGLGKLRHLDVEDLWVQDNIRNKHVEIHKVLETDNPADMFTKCVDSAAITKALKFMGLYSKQRRAKSSSSIVTSTQQ